MEPAVFKSDMKSALSCIEGLLETGISEEQLLQSAELLTDSQYSDVIDERNIDHLCGYPLCDNQLENITRQKYHISTATNQVFDITQRKKFCSSQCFKASNYFASQLSSLPPSARTAKQTVQLLSLSETPYTKPVENKTVAPKKEVSLQANKSKPKAVDEQFSVGIAGSVKEHSIDEAKLSSLLENTTLTQTNAEDITAIQNPSETSEFSNKYIARILSSFEVWLASDLRQSSSGVMHPPLHDMCVTQVQRSLFISQIRSTLLAIGAQPAGVVELASSFKLTNKTVAFRPPQWRIIVLILIAISQGPQSINRGTLDSSLKELNANKEDFDLMLVKVRELYNLQT